eukprot:gene16193-7561_t
MPLLPSRFPYSALLTISPVALYVEWLLAFAAFRALRRYTVTECSVTPLAIYVQGLLVFASQRQPFMGKSKRSSKA